jgi:hypothetical protein
MGPFIEAEKDTDEPVPLKAPYVEPVPGADRYYPEYDPYDLRPLYSDRPD